MDMLKCRAMLLCLALFCILTACERQLEYDDNNQVKEPDAENSGELMYTQEDYAEMRQSMPYEPFSIDYENLYAPEGYLGVDHTAGILEYYLGYALIGYWEISEIEDVLLDHNLLFQASSFCTKGFRWNEADEGEIHPALKDVLLNHYGKSIYSLTPKEHLDLTARYLFGDECVIDYDKLDKPGVYSYSKEQGLSYRDMTVKAGREPIVLDYSDQGDHYQVTIVFLTWDNYLSDEYDYYYVNENSDETTDDRYIKLSKEMALEFCYSSTPDKYIVRIDKGENGSLYLRSILLNAGTDT